MKPLLIKETAFFKINDTDIGKIYGISNVGKLKGGIICKFYHEEVSQNLYKTETIVKLFFPDKSIITALPITEPIKNINIKDCLITKYQELSTKDFLYILKIKDNYFFLSHESAKNFISADIKLHTYP